MNIGEAVKERIIELCRERDISINKLCNMSGVTQSQRFQPSKSYAMAWVSRFRSFLRQICLPSWSRRSNNMGGDCYDAAAA